VYDPTIGRWLSEDPIDFEGGDPDLYRYCGNDPANKTDPSGLVEVDTLKNNKFKIADGRDAIVRVEKNVRMSGKDGWCKLTFQTNLDNDNPIDDYHWLQFSRSYRKKGKEYSPGKYYVGDGEDIYRRYATDKEGKGLTTHVDTLKKNILYYDELDVEKVREAYFLKIWDKPTDRTDKDDYSETGTVLDAYLVNAKTKVVYYHVHYERVSRQSGGKWKSDWEAISGDVVKELPPVLKQKEFHVGWEDDAYTKPITIANPGFKVK